MKWTPTSLLLAGKEAQIEGDVVPDDDGILYEAGKPRQHLLNTGRPAKHARGDAVHGLGLLRYVPARINQLIEDFAAQDAAIDDTHGGYRDDLVPSSGFRPVVSVSITV